MRQKKRGERRCSPPIPRPVLALARAPDRARRESRRRAGRVRPLVESSQLARRVQSGDGVGRGFHLRDDPPERGEDRGHGEGRVALRHDGEDSGAHPLGNGGEVDSGGGRLPGLPGLRGGGRLGGGGGRLGRLGRHF